MNVIQCNMEHAQSAAELFDQYRMFYEQESDLSGCYAFIKENIENARSKIFLLYDDGAAVGFSQLYASYCSISMRSFYYLSDLYIDRSCRKKGYARFLMNYLTEHFAKLGAHRLTLETATTNTAAQRLYESLGYQREKVFITYHQMLER